MVSPRAHLRRGVRDFEGSLADFQSVVRLEARTLPPSAPASEQIRDALERPIGSPPLRDLARGKRSAAILVPGKERVAAASDYVPALIDELVRGGIREDAIEVFLATGTHEHHLESDIRELLGAGVAARVRCHAHDCLDDRSLVELGVTRRGTPVLINRKVLDADVRVVTGRIVPHYFAGFSGGRKAWIPGVAGMRTIVANHRLTIDPEQGLHPHARPCALDANPVHLDMVDGLRFARPEFCLNTLLDAEHRVVGVVAGDVEAAHAVGCRQADEMFHLRLPAPVDALVTSAGGAPYDYNFMQSLKAVFDLQDVVRPGGRVLWIAECTRGIQPEFLRWCAIASDAELERSVRERYDLKGHNSLMLRRLIRRADVALWSDLPVETVAALGLVPVRSLDEGLAWLGERQKGGRVAIAPHANVIAASIGS